MVKQSGRFEKCGEVPFGPLGAPDSVITTGSTVVSLNTCSPGLPIVALVAMNFKFSLPHSRHTLSTLRNTFPTCDPPTPRKTCASSNTRNSKLCQKLGVHFLGYPGKIRWCNESGLVKTICVFSVFIRARCASDESPSQVALVIFEMARSLCNVFLSPSNEPLSAKRPAAFVSCECVHEKSQGLGQGCCAARREYTRIRTRARPRGGRRVCESPTIQPYLLHFQQLIVRERFQGKQQHGS
jgi:hypothetical protein